MSNGKYATNLLDGFELLYKRTDVALDSCGEISKFLKKLSSVVGDYGKSLSRATKDAQKGSKAADQEIGTLKSAWDVLLVQLDTAAEQHNKWANGALNDASTSILAYQKEKEKERIRLVSEGKRLTKEVAEAHAALKSAQKNYRARCEESEKAQAAYLKAKNDSAIKPKDLNKLAVKSTQASDKANTADKDYQTSLKNCNQRQERFYTTEMPQLLNEFQRFEEDRVEFLKQSLERVASAFAEFPGALQSVTDSINNIVNSINKDSDTDLFVQQYKTGVTPPPEILYEPYDKDSSAPSSVAVSSPSFVSHTSSPHSVDNRSTAPTALVTTAKPVAKVETSKQVGLGAGDAGLSNDQKIEKLELQLREVKNNIKAESKSKKGLEKLVRFYASDPVAQEKAKGELEEQSKKLGNLREQRRVIEKQLSELLGADFKADNDDRSDDEDDDTPAQGVSGGIASGGSLLNVSMQQQQVQQQSVAPAAEATEVVARVRALYDYEATNENELSFPEGAILNVREQDGSGWWFAEFNGATGFIPSNYAEMI